MRPILNTVRNENSYSILSGDYNLNLLKTSEKTAISEFFDLMAGKGFVPTITLPTRFDKKSCSLIDHIWVNKPSKGALEPARASSRVFLKKFAKADHVPCLLSLDILEHKIPAPKYVCSQKIDDESIAAFRIDLAASNLANSINPSPEGDVEETYTTINETLGQLREKHFPVRKIRFRRYQHKIQPWMTDIILLNIKEKDETYIQFRKEQSPLVKARLKSKLKTMENDLSEWITGSLSQILCPTV